MKNPTREQLELARNKRIPDQLKADLAVWFVGINPSLYSAAVGHHFARPGNRFWPALHDAGFTPELLSPSEDYRLPHFGAGLTNLVARATARADELSKAELIEGGEILAVKATQLRPGWLVFVGITAYRSAFGSPKATMGEQAETVAGRAVWVLPNPSGLNAHYQRADFKRLFAELRSAVE